MSMQTWYSKRVTWFLQLVENEKIMRERAMQANEEEEAMLRERMREAKGESM